MNIRTVDLGVYRGPEPLTPSDWQQLKDLGIKYNLDLQTDSPIDGEPTDETRTAGMYGITVISHPLSEFTAPTRVQLDDGCVVINSSKPIYVHCRAGKDRTGMQIARYRIRNGWTKAVAVKEMWAMGFHFWYFWWVWYL